MYVSFNSPQHCPKRSLAYLSAVIMLHMFTFGKRSLERFPSDNSSVHIIILLAMLHCGLVLHYSIVSAKPFCRTYELICGIWSSTQSNLRTVLLEIVESPSWKCSDILIPFPAFKLYSHVCRWLLRGAHGY